MMGSARRRPAKWTSSVPATALLLMFAATACSFLSPEKDKTRYAVLASVDELPGGAPAEMDADTARTLRVGLGPIALPDYLLRSEVVTRHDGTRIVPSETERWSEPFDRGVERVLAVDLERALGAGRIVHHPWYQTNRPDVQIEVAFARCEREALPKGASKVVVAARWTVRELADSGRTIERESRIEKPDSGADGASTALALSQALADLAAEIAEAQKASPSAPARSAADSAPR